MGSVWVSWVLRVRLLLVGSVSLGTLASILESISWISDCTNKRDVPCWLPEVVSLTLSPAFFVIRPTLLGVQYHSNASANAEAATTLSFPQRLIILCLFCVDLHRHKSGLFSFLKSEMSSHRSTSRLLGMLAIVRVDLLSCGATGQKTTRWRLHLVRPSTHDKCVMLRVQRRNKNGTRKASGSPQDLTTLWFTGDCVVRVHAMP